MVGEVGVSIESERRTTFGAVITMHLQMFAHYVINKHARIVVVKELKREQGRIHDYPCRGRLGRGSNAMGRGSHDLGRGMLKYKLSYP